MKPNNFKKNPCVFSLLNIYAAILKSPSFLTLLFLICCRISYSQCPNVSSLQFDSQQKINEFQVNFPECRQLNSDILIISEKGEITDLSPLSQIISINGSLTIRNNTAIKSLKGLENLQSVNKSLVISDNSSLESISDLRKLSNILDYFIIRGSSKLVTLEGLEGLTFVGGDMEISYLPLLKNVKGLDNLSVIRGKLSIYNLNIESISAFSKLEFLKSILLSSLPELKSIDGLSGLKFFERNGEFTIANCNKLASIDGLNNLESYPQSLYIADNPLLSQCSSKIICRFIERASFITIRDNAFGCANIESVKARCKNCIPYYKRFTTQQDVNTFKEDFPLCTVIEGSFDISGNDINDLTPFEKIITINGNLIIQNNPSLSKLNTFKNLKEIGLDYKLVNNPNLEKDSDGLPVINKIGGNFIINQQPNYTDFKSYISLTKLGGLNANGNRNLENFVGIEKIDTTGVVMAANLPKLSSLSGLSSLKVASSLILENLPELKSINQLGNLSLVKQDLSILVENLQSFEGLEKLKSIGNNAHFISRAVTSMKGLDNLESVGWQLSIKNCDELKHINELKKLTSIGAILVIEENNKLQNIEGLKNLKGLSYQLWIINNKELLSLKGIDNLELANSITNAVFINNNPKLKICGVKSICEYMVTSKPLYLSGNHPDCNTKANIDQNCNALLIAACEQSKKDIQEIYSQPMSRCQNSGPILAKLTPDLSSGSFSSSTGLQLEKKDIGKIIIESSPLGNHKLTYKLNSNQCSLSQTFDFEIFPVDFIVRNEEACFKYKADDGREFTESGVYEIKFKNRYGCDSTVRTNFKIKKFDFTTSVEPSKLTAFSENALYKWSECTQNGKIEIIGETNSTLTTDKIGSFSAKIFKNGCTTETECLQNIILNSEEMIQEKVKIYPNPTDKFIVIQVENNKVKFKNSNIELKIHSSNGQKVDYEALEFKTNEILITLKSSLPSGAYYVILNDGVNSIKARFLKK